MSHTIELFPLGAVEVGPGAAAALAGAGINPSTYLTRHRGGDWEGEDRSENQWAVQYGHQVWSTYRLPTGTEICVITSVDRTCTRLLLASEFEDREVGTLEGYDVWARTYDVEKNPLIAIEESRVNELVAGLPIADALDVGCGTGRHALKLARRGARVTAMDQSTGMLAKAREAAMREGLPIEFHEASIRDGLPFASGCFDFVICALVLSHDLDMPAALREFHRVLRPGGHAVITDWHPWCIAQGWRNVFFTPGTAHLLPSSPNAREDYLEAVGSAGFELLTVSDVLIGEIPEGYAPEGFRRDLAHEPFCLIILARKPGGAG